MSDHRRVSFDEQRGAIESMLTSVFGNVRYDYLSGPITGGPRYLRWQSTVGQAIEGDEKDYSLLLKRQVIDPNIKDLIALADLFRRSGKQIIEPGSFESPASSWAQQEFYRFWEGIITERANNVIFADGWHLSVGCTYEFLCAVRADKPTIAQSGQELDASSAVDLIGEAVTSITGSSPKLDRYKTRLLAMKEAIRFAHEEMATR